MPVLLGLALMLLTGGLAGGVEVTFSGDMRTRWFTQDLCADTGLPYNPVLSREQSFQDWSGSTAMAAGLAAFIAHADTQTLPKAEIDWAAETLKKPSTIVSQVHCRRTTGPTGIWNVHAGGYVVPEPIPSNGMRLLLRATTEVFKSKVRSPRESAVEGLGDQAFAVSGIFVLSSGESNLVEFRDFRTKNAVLWVASQGTVASGPTLQDPINAVLRRLRDKLAASSPP